MGVGGKSHLKQTNRVQALHTFLCDVREMAVVWCGLVPDSCWFPGGGVNY